MVYCLKDDFRVRDDGEFNGRSGERAMRGVFHYEKVLRQLKGHGLRIYIDVRVFLSIINI